MSEKNNGMNEGGVPEKVGFLKKVGDFAKRNWKKALAGAGIFVAGALTDRVITNRRNEICDDYDYDSEVETTTEENL